MGREEAASTRGLLNTAYAVVDRIIPHLGSTFAAEKPPQVYAFEQVAPMAGEESGECR